MDKTGLPALLLQHQSMFARSEMVHYACRWNRRRCKEKQAQLHLLSRFITATVLKAEGTPNPS
jgi:hypothetical protein